MSPSRAASRQLRVEVRSGVAALAGERPQPPHPRLRPGSRRASTAPARDRRTGGVTHPWELAMGPLHRRRNLASRAAASCAVVYHRRRPTWVCGLRRPLTARRKGFLIACSTTGRAGVGRCRIQLVDAAFARGVSCAAMRRCRLKRFSVAHACGPRGPCAASVPIGRTTVGAHRSWFRANQILGFSLAVAVPLYARDEVLVHQQNTPDLTGDGTARRSCDAKSSVARRGRAPASATTCRRHQNELYEHHRSVRFLGVWPISAAALVEQFVGLFRTLPGGAGSVRYWNELRPNDGGGAPVLPWGREATGTRRRRTRFRGAIFGTHPRP